MKSPKKPSTRGKAVAAKKQEKATPVDMSTISSTTTSQLHALDDLKEPGGIISEGVGDTISKVTKALGIKECEACIKRRNILNRAFSYLQLSRDVTEEESLFIDRLNKRPGYIADADIKPLFDLYNSLFNKNLSSCRCGGAIAQIMKIINSSFKYHRDEDSK